MSKNIVQDVLPPQKSIRNIPLPARRKVHTRIVQEDTKNHVDRAPREERYEEKKDPNDSKIWIVFLLCAFIFILIFSAMSFFAGATISITPQQGFYAVDSSIKTSNDNSTALKYKLAKTELTESLTVRATETKNLEERARGEILVYNNHSTQNQRLITNTRFEGSNGLIYRIEESVIVPGKKTINGKTTPGSAKAKIIAEDAGEKYNAKNMDFTLPGFKNLPQYKNIYARSSSEISGGYIGEIRVVDEKTRQETIAALEKKLSDKIKLELTENAPAQFITYDSTLDIKFEMLPEKSENAGVTITIKGTGYTMLFDRENLTNEIAKQINTEKIKLPVEILNLSDLVLGIEGTDTWKGENGGEVTLNLDGKLYFVSKIDKDKLLQDLRGAKKSNITAIFTKYPHISRANVSIKPLWKRSVPNELEKIKVIETINYKKI